MAAHRVASASAGGLAVSRTAEIAGGNSIPLHVAHLPEGQDPADLLPGNRALLEQTLREAVPIEHHLITEAVGRHDLDTPEGVARAIHNAGEIIAAMNDQKERDQAVEFVATLVDRDASSVRLYLSEPSDRLVGHRRTREQGIGVA